MELLTLQSVDKKLNEGNNVAILCLKCKMFLSVVKLT